MGVTFGIHIGPQNIDIQDLRRLWTYADTHGFKWISVWDHFYEAPPVDGNSPHFEAVALMSAIACETRNVEIGCLVFCASYRNPGLLTKSLITIDHLSGGRAAIGLGAGWHEMEHNAFGYPFRPPKERLDLLEENIRAIRMLLDQDRTTFEGTYVRLTNAAMYPKPVRRPMPIWVGGQGERRTLRIAARYADGWNVPYIGPEDYKHKSEVLDRWCEKEGRDPATIKRSINLGFYMAASQAQAEAAWDKLRRQWGASERSPRSPEAMAAGSLVGGPRDVVDQIGRFVDVGVTALNIAFRPPVDWEALDAFVEEVMPKFA
jgi:F420-dependent oxidoreductase-like protein